MGEAFVSCQKKAPEQNPSILIWQATWWGAETGQDTVGCSLHLLPLSWASRAQQHPETTGKKSHLTSAPGAKLRRRKHLLKEGKEALQGTESLDPAPAWSWCPHVTLTALGLSFPICTIKGPVRDHLDSVRGGKIHRGWGVAWATQQDGQDCH